MNSLVYVHYLNLMPTLDHGLFGFGKGLRFVLGVLCLAVAVCHFVIDIFISIILVITWCYFILNGGVYVLISSATEIAVR